MRRSLAAISVVLGFVVTTVVATTVAAPPAAGVPAGFTDTLIANVGAPTAVAAAGGRLLVTTQQGQVRVYRDGALLATPALNLTSVTCSNSERGLLGIAVDPGYPSQPFVYAYYTRNKSGLCVNRLSRFTFDAANHDLITSASEVVLFDNIPSTAGNHNAGDVNFLKDGTLVFSIGDGGCDYASGGGCGAQNDAARDRHVALGKLMRINRDGTVPANNPFGGNPNRCSDDGFTTTGAHCPETWVWGLRNPFRFAVDPNAAGNRVYINDVGQNTWEEIDDVFPGADYAWNLREGHCVTGSTTSCGFAPQGFTNPIHDYNRSTGCASITGGAFVPNGAWGAAYDGDYLFGDFVCGKIFRLEPVGSSYSRSEFHTGLGGSSAVHLEFVGSTLYYTTYAGGGQLRAISTGSTNQAPTARLSASPLSGSVGMVVTFDGSASTDPEGNPLTYLWQFGDGTPGTSTSTATTTHQYNAPGSFVASLLVRDSLGNTSAVAATATINVVNTSNNPPTVTITAPPASSRFSVGQQVTVQAAASDPDGQAVSLTWDVRLRHGGGTPTSHTHPLTTGSGAAVGFGYPAPEDLPAAATSWVEATVTASDGAGGTATASISLLPKLVSITLQSSQPGAGVSVNGDLRFAPSTYLSWANWVVTISAIQPPGYRFWFWSDFKPQTHTIVTPQTNTSYKAYFTR